MSHPTDLTRPLAAMLLAIALAGCARAVTPFEPFDGAVVDASTPRPDVPTAPIDHSRVVEVRAGYEFACGRRAMGAVVCWGRNQVHQLGDGTAIDRPTPVTVLGLTDTIEIALSTTDGCALRATGSVLCWGTSSYGALGDGMVEQHDTPAPVQMLADARIVASSPTDQLTCAVRGDGTVVCFGDGAFGQLGNGTRGSMVGASLPTTVSGLGDAANVAVGSNHVCAVRASGGVVCWGDNTHGQLGDGTTTSHSTPTAVAMLSGAIAIGAGDLYSCALESTGRVLCWGSNGGGHLGTMVMGDASTVPVAVDGVTDASAIAVGTNHACAIRGGGAVVCWGSESNGELGRGTTTSVGTPAPVIGLTDAVAITAGQDFTCAARMAGGVVCWGANRYGQLGDGTTTDRATPTAVLGLP